ncbi:MAG: hypothetical protein ACOZQL_12945 [Myxococcota bacterium]
MRARRSQGFAMMVVMMIMALLALVAIFALSNASTDRQRAIRHVRGETRESCTLGGLTYARNFFASRYTSWSSFLADPANYNPIYAGGTAVANLGTIGTIAGTHPELFVDLDGDGKRDAYIFVRDNYDEFAPALPNFARDNDQNVIIGALCISETMVPRREDNSLDDDQLMVESILAYNQIETGYQSQAQGGSGGDGNRNKE